MFNIFHLKLSAGGSVVHPDVLAILVTPICPHSLSFRPLIVPDGLELKVEVADSNRGNVWVITKCRYIILLHFLGFF